MQIFILFISLFLTACSSNKSNFPDGSEPLEPVFMDSGRDSGGSDCGHK